jgi:hypothetical protein
VNIDSSRNIWSSNVPSSCSIFLDQTFSNRQGLLNLRFQVYTDIISLVIDRMKGRNFPFSFLFSPLSQNLKWLDTGLEMVIKFIGN